MKEELLKTLESMTDEELVALKQKIDEVLRERKRDEQKVYEFSFEATADPRKGIPFVARLYINGAGELKREFFNLQRQYGKKQVTVFGKFKAREGDVIEQRTGGTWNNEWRCWYVVANGKLEKVADIDNSREKLRVIKYLKNEISLEELLK